VVEGSNPSGSVLFASHAALESVSEVIDWQSLTLQGELAPAEPKSDAVSQRSLFFSRLALWWLECDLNGNPGARRETPQRLSLSSAKARCSYARIVLR